MAAIYHCQISLKNPKPFFLASQSIPHPKIEKNKTTQNMSDYVPSEVYREIFLRLPADSLLRLRSVCKAWRHLIDDPIFVKSHQLSNCNTLLIRNKTGAPLYLINLDSIDFTKSARQLIDVMPVKQLIRPGVPLQRDLPAPPCKGLILISSDDKKKIWAIWNPLTRSCHQLPPPPDAAASFKLSPKPAIGLGYVYDADDYWVVRIDHLTCKRVIATRTLVYSLKLGCWRRIKDCPYHFWSPYWSDNNGVYLNGALHWLSKEMVLFVLDLGTEDYRQLPLPPPIATLEREIGFDVQLDAIGGCLSMTLSDRRTNHFSGWVMKDYGADWVKLFTLDLGRCGAYVEMPRRLVAFLENKKQVFFQQDRGFLWYDVESGDVKQVTIHGLRRIASSQICPGSIYRLDDCENVASGNVGSKKRKRNKTKKGVSTRLTFCIKDCDTWCCSDDSCLSPDSPPHYWYEFVGLDDA